MIPSHIPANVEGLRTPEAVVAAELEAKLKSLESLAASFSLTELGQRPVAEVRAALHALEVSVPEAARFGAEILAQCFAPPAELFDR